MTRRALPLPPSTLDVLPVHLLHWSLNLAIITKDNVNYRGSKNTMQTGFRFHRGFPPQMVIGT
jgi:hypothetical protein